MYVEGIDASIAREYGQVVDSPGEAEVAVVRLSAPYEQRNGSFLESRFHAGDLDFKEPERTRILDLLGRVPTIVDICLDRPAVIPELAEHSASLLADFGADDTAVLDVIFGRYVPSGRLPFELPSSMESVRRQKEDVPFDSEQPLFPFGHGLTVVRQ
jgi:beta-glucosidase